MSAQHPTTLLVMAAGMGSRFGGLKQLTPMGPNGEVILDYSLFDAKKAGFDKAVFVIKKEIEKDFREVIGKRVEKYMDVEYAFQELDKLPAGFTVPEGRKKPWGTAHAVLCARDVVKTPFAVINADDFYGSDPFAKLEKHLETEKEIAMVGFQLGKTLTENGTVSRGVCDVKDGWLMGVTEHTALDRNSGFPADTPVSMNFWGFQPDFFNAIETGMERWLNADHDALKGEYYLPSVVDDLIHNGGEKVRVLRTDSQWYGVTYREDTPVVVDAIAKLTKAGLYEGI